MTVSLRCAISLLFFCVMAPATASSQILQDPRQHQLLLRGIDETLNQRYDSAEAVFSRIINEFPSHPVGYLYLAGMLQAKFTDYGDRFNEERYDGLLDAAIEKAKPFLDDPKRAASGHYYTGAAKAFRSFTRSENGNIPSSVYFGLAAGSSMERCLEIDSSYVEARNILGSFYFWRSKLAWIPFVPDRSAEGIAMVERSFNHPYEKHLASHNLMVIFTEGKRYADAVRYGNAMLAEYPENRLFLWDLMTVYEQWGREKELETVVQRLFKSTLGAPVINRYTEAVCRLKLAQFALSRNDRTTARDHLTAIIVLRPFIGRTKGDLRKKIDAADDLLDTLR